jgi:hypothetical protein
MTFLTTLMIKSARRETSDMNSIVGNETGRARRSSRAAKADAGACSHVPHCD